MYISTKAWKKFVEKLSKINQAASDSVVEYIQKNGFSDRDALIRYCYEVASKYGNASATYTAMMYDAISEMSDAFYPAAELAPTPEYGEVAKTVNGVLKSSQNVDEMAGAIARLVKRTGQDTILYNGIRDGAEFAWIPSGDTCAFCIALASRGWQTISKESLKKGHAEHIHSNCDCTYMVRHNSSFDVPGYDPQTYKDMYYGDYWLDKLDGEAYDDFLDEYNFNDGFHSKDNINSMRRLFYQENRKTILEQKKSAYEKRKELNSSEAEEVKV